jgi:2-isopropylmalate synthase
MQKVRLTDITLREASLELESSLSFKEKIEIAKLLDKLNMDTIALAPITNARKDTLLVRTIASAVKKSTLSIPSGYTEESVCAAWDAIRGAANPRICVEMPVSVVQMEFMCRKKPAAVLEMIDALVRRSKSLCPDVEFSALDATRSEPDFLAKVLETAVAAGAGTVTICDSAGTMIPDEFKNFIENLCRSVPVLKNVCISVKCTDELSMAAACSAVSAFEAGVREINVMVNDGKAPTIESIVHIMQVRGDAHGVSCDIKATELHRSVKQMKWLTQTKRAETSPFDNGVSMPVSKDRDILLDANDNIATVNKAVKKLGYDLSEEDQAKVFETFMNVAEKKSVGTKELEAIIATAALQVPPTYKLVSYVINSGNVIGSTAVVKFQKNGKYMQGLALGNGPIDASFLAIEQITGRHYELDDFQIQAVTEGREAMGSTLVRLRSNGKLYSGNGLSTDIIGASIGAYLSALNKIVYEEKHK